MIGLATPFARFSHVRNLPAVDLDIVPQSGWTWLLDGLAVIVLATLAAWFLGAAPAISTAAQIAFLAIGLLVVTLAWRLRSSRGLHLRWDGQHWFCTTAEQGLGSALTPGRLSVMVDLQLAMLLRFAADDSSARPRVGWFAVQRRGLGGRWHELRCAAFSAPRLEDVDAPVHPLETRQ